MAMKGGHEKSADGTKIGALTKNVQTDNTNGRHEIS